MRSPALIAQEITFKHLSGDRLLLDALGSELSRAYLAVRQEEWEAMKDMELDREVTLLLERY